MTRVKAATRVLANCYWSHKNIDIKIRPIYSHGTGEIIGYFDRISVKCGQISLDGWINSDTLTVLTDVEAITIRPNLERSDVSGAGKTPGFSIKLQGSRALRYSAGQGQPFLDLEIGGRFAEIKTAMTCLYSLMLFALYYYRDIWAYFAWGDVLAGDRLEHALQSTVHPPARPEAANALFGRRELPTVEEPVDIIVPVHNAYHELRRCLNCLADHTERRHRIILIDDASTDPLVRPLLEIWALRRGNVKLLLNDQNEGFVKSVNSALSLARGHVVLLNSDAFVGADWLERMLAPMLADCRVASVTPLSNAAEILSVPFSRKCNEVHAIQSKMIDTALEKLDWRTACCEVPTGIGFCMLMNRKWLDREPMLDHSFGKGYGEEVDWCRKVSRLGAIHIGHGGLFVEHKGASSFTTTSARTRAKNQEIISNRYPDFDFMIQEFRQRDPLIGSRLVAALALFDDKDPVSVFLAHDSGGGAEIWLSEQVAMHSSKGMPCVVVRGRPHDGAVIVEIYYGGQCESGLIPRVDLPKYLNILGPINLIYSCLALTSNPLEILEICLNNLRPKDTIDVLFHDFFPICPSHNLIGHDTKFCGLPDLDGCDTCYAKMAANNAAWPARIEDWRLPWLRLLQRADRVVTFSNSTCDLVLQVWPQLRHKLTVEPHSMNWLPPSISPPATDRVVVGVLGSIGYQKGAGIVRELTKTSKGAFEIVIVGHFDPSFACAGIKVHGDYAREDIEALARRYKVTCWLVPSIWPETFCYAAREAIATGLPVVGFDLGAQGEAIRNSQNGLVLPVDCRIDEIRDAIMSLGRDQDMPIDEGYFIYEPDPGEIVSTTH